MSLSFHLLAKLGDEKRAYEFYLRTSRLDLDDYNNDTEDGCHTTSMAGTWLAVVEGFGGMRVKEGILNFNPFIPKKWQAFSFKIKFRGALLNIKVSKDGVLLDNLSSKKINLKVFDVAYEIDGFTHQKIILEKVV